MKHYKTFRVEELQLHYFQGPRDIYHGAYTTPN